MNEHEHEREAPQKAKGEKQLLDNIKRQQMKFFPHLWDGASSDQEEDNVAHL